MTPLATSYTLEDTDIQRLFLGATTAGEPRQRRTKRLNDPPVARPTVSTRETAADLAALADFGTGAQLEQAAPSAFTQMAMAAEIGDEAGFLVAYRAIDWEDCPADQIAAAVRYALNAQAHLAARKLALLGAARFPDHAELRRMAHVLAPPVAHRQPRDPSKDVKADTDWLKRHRDAFQGRWVALRNGELLAVANSLAGIIAQTGPIKNTGILVTAVY